MDEVQEVQAAQHSDVVLLVEKFQVAQDGVGEHGVKAGHRLIGQEEARLLHQGAGDADALLLAAGELVGAVVSLVFDADAGQGGRGPAAVVGRETPHQAPEGMDVAQPPGQHVGHDAAAPD